MINVGGKNGNKHITAIETDIAQRAINIKSVPYNAKGDGVTDDTAAIKAAIEYAITVGKTKIEVPAGNYSVTTRVFSDITASFINGLLFSGSGRTASIFTLKTNGAEAWFYDNQSISNQKFARLMFEHIGFETDDTTKGNGFKQWSQGQEKQFRFFDCSLNLGKIMQFEGTGNSDLNRFLLCYLTANDRAFTFNNNQSVSTELISCDAYLSKGLAYIDAGGGGSFHVSGGNYEMHEHATDTSDHYLIEMSQNPNMGQGNCDFNFTDMRFEIHGINKKLVKTYADTDPLIVNFTRCAFGTVTAGSREVVDVTPTKKVTFTNCVLHKDFTYKASGTFSTSGGSPSNAQLFFYNCDVGTASGTSLYSRITVSGDAYRVIAENCSMQSGAVSASTVVQDFDMGWKYAASRGGAGRKKVIPIKQAQYSFPNATDTTRDWTVTIPTGCTVTRIYIKKPAFGISTADYQLFIGSSDKVTVLGSSTLAQHQVEHVIDISHPGELSFNVLKLWAGGTANVFQSGGILYVEYI